MLPPINQDLQGPYSVQQSSFNSPPVLYSQSQPMLVTNQNNMNYQMVNLGAGAILQKMQQRQQEEKIIDLLSRQNELMNEIADDFNWRMNQKLRQEEQDLEELERKQIIMRQKKAEQEYLYKLNRQLNFGLQRIREQQLKRVVYPNQPKQLAMKVPSIINLERIEEVYPNPRYAREKIKFADSEVQADAQQDLMEFYQNPFYSMPNQNYSQQYYNYQQQMPPPLKNYVPQFQDQTDQDLVNNLQTTSQKTQQSKSKKVPTETQFSKNPSQTQDKIGTKKQISRQQLSRQSQKSHLSRLSQKSPLMPIEEQKQLGTQRQLGTQKQLDDQEGYDSQENEDDYISLDQNNKK